MLLCNFQQVFESLEKWEESKKKTCHNCGEVHDIEKMHIGSDEELYCEGCFYDMFSTCDSCGEVISNDNSYSDDSGEGTYCHSCFDERYQSCDQCGNTISNDDTYHTIHGENICEGCAENYSSCNDCGELVPDDEIELHDGDHYCHDCHIEIHRRDGTPVD
jgi:formylmethanofuran dehydrogenase subunit E